MANNFNVNGERKTIVQLNYNSSDKSMTISETEGLLYFDKQNILYASLGNFPTSPIRPNKDKALITTDPWQATTANTIPEFSLVDTARDYNRDGKYYNAVTHLYTDGGWANIREIDWMDKHDLAGEPCTPGLKIMKGAKITDYEVRNFDNNEYQYFVPMGKPREDHPVRGTRYIFGFYYGLKPPITIYLKEYSINMNAPYLFASLQDWERVGIRIGWLSNDPIADKIYEATFISEQKQMQGKHPAGNGISNAGALESITIHLDNLPATALANKIHWIELEDLGKPGGNPEQNGADIWFRVSADIGDPLPIMQNINVVFLLDYSGSIAWNDTKKNNIKVQIESAINAFNQINTSGTIRYAIRVVGAGSVQDDFYKNDQKYRAYAEDNPANYLTASQSIKAFGEDVPTTILDTCKGVYNSGAKEAYSPIWRGISDVLDDFSVKDSAGVPLVQPDDINLLMIYTDGDETSGGYITPDIAIPARKEVIYEVARIIVKDTGGNVDTIYTKAVQYIRDNKGIINPLPEGDPAYDANYEPYQLSATEKDVCSTALITLSDAPSLSEITSMPSLCLPEDAVPGEPPVVRPNIESLWNNLIAAWFNKEMSSKTESALLRAAIGDEPLDTNSIEWRLYKLLYDYEIQSNIYVYDSSGHINNKHPLTTLGADVGPQPKIGKSLAKKLWCHEKCRKKASTIQPA